MSNLGKWAPWYEDTAPEPQAYGDTDAYRLGAEWLAGCALIEDWGCGLGWFRQFIDPDRYRGLDGTASPFADQVVDLVDYRSTVPGVFMRHVLEHNHQWAQILDNAVASFTERMCLVLFTPLAETTCVIADDSGGLGVPDIAFSLDDLTARFPPPVSWFLCKIESETAYGIETILYLQR